MAVSQDPENRLATITVPVAPGELVDKITILEIKCARIADPAKLTNVRHELALLEASRDQAVGPSEELSALTRDLTAVNEKLWQIEDDIRACETTQDFGERFVSLARAVYRNNDLRAAIKRRINQLLGSAILEEKSYKPY